MIFSFGFIWAEQQKKDDEIKNNLIKDGFGSFTFSADGQYKYSWKEMSESLSFEGKYKIESGIVIFESACKIKINGYDTDGNNLNLGIPGKYRIDSEKKNEYHQGALVNIENDIVYWSNKKPSANEKAMIDETECILFPQEGPNKKYAVLLENLKIRKRPSTKADALVINGYESDIAYMNEKRSIEFAGSVLWIKAKSINEDAIDGKKSPWYYVMCSDELNNFDGMRYFGWIYGGYVKLIEQSEIKKYEEEYKPLLKKKLKEAGAQMN